MKDFKQFSEMLSRRSLQANDRSLDGPAYPGSWPERMRRYGSTEQSPEDPVQVPGYGAMNRKHALKQTIRKAREIADRLEEGDDVSLDDFALLLDFYRTYLGTRA